MLLRSYQVFPTPLFTHYRHSHTLGNYETIKKGDVPCMGTVRLTSENVQRLMARKGVPIGPLHKYVKDQTTAAT